MKGQHEGGCTGNVCFRFPLWRYLIIGSRLVSFWFVSWLTSVTLCRLYHERFGGFPSLSSLRTRLGLSLKQANVLSGFCFDFNSFQ